MIELHVGDVGTEIVLDCGTDVSNSTFREIIAKKPDESRVHWVASVADETSIKYVLQAGDLNVAGNCRLQTYVEFPNWKWRGTPTKMMVRNKI